MCYYICTKGGLASRCEKLYRIFIQNEIMDYSTNDNIYIILYRSNTAQLSIVLAIYRCYNIQ